MKTAFFIVTWDISDTSFDGPYETLEIAKDNLDKHEDAEHCVIVSLPVHFTRARLLYGQGLTT